MEPYQLTLSARGSVIDVNLALGAPRRPVATVLKGNPCDAVSMYRSSTGDVGSGRQTCLPVVDDRHAYGNSP